MRKRVISKVIFGIYAIMVVSSPLAKAHTVNNHVLPSEPPSGPKYPVVIQELEIAQDQLANVEINGRKLSEIVNLYKRRNNKIDLIEQDKKIVGIVTEVDKLNDAIKEAKVAVHKARQKEREENQSPPILGAGVIQTCPVAGPNSFTDTFGAPRVGHTHQGIDLISPYGTPIVAVYPGVASAHPNTLGGNAVIVNHTNGDFTYYAHMSSYGQMGPVQAGDIIGYVGATGDTNTNHLHFEYHPGGGYAIDPYSLLLAVC